MAWSLTVPTRHVDADGTARIVALLGRDGVEHAVTVEVTDGGELTVLAESPAEGPALQFVGAWSNR